MKKQFRVFGLLSLAVLPVLASACSLFGFGAQMVNQENMIIWDKDKGIEHFIRRASFNAKGEKVGFVAPTPSIPELGEIDPKVFETAKRIVQEREKRIEEARRSTTKGMDAAAAEAGAVEVVQIANVAGYKAITISAEKTEEVEKWIKENKFESFEGQKEWFDVYLAKKWFLTFFLVEKDKQGNLATGTVRMSFKTDKPFNPYYVPKGNQNPRANLLLYFISKEAHKPEMEIEADSQKTHQFRLSSASFNQIKADLKDVNVDFSQPVIYALDDSKFAQGASEDLYFSPEDRATVPNEFDIPGQSGNGAKVAVFVCFMGAFVAIMSALRAKKAKLIG